MMKAFWQLFLFFLLLFLSSDRARGLALSEDKTSMDTAAASKVFLNAVSLDKILRANDAASLKRHVQKEKDLFFLRSLCAKKNTPGIKKSGPLAACYRLLSLRKGFMSLSALDSRCLSLKTSHFDRDLLKQSLQTREISPACRRRLTEKLKILSYRKRDELVPGLETSEKRRASHLTQSREKTLDSGGGFF